MRSPVNQFLFDVFIQPCFRLAAFLVVASPALNASITQVRLTPSPVSPQLLGTTIQLTASAVDSDSGPLTYKWEIQRPFSSSFSVIRDFDLATTLTWTPNFVEGTYQLRLTARDYLAGTSAQRVISFQANPLVTGSQPVVVATTSPLVALFSAPTCTTGSTMQVVFQQVGSTVQSFTDWRHCHPGSMNFYIAGMLANQTYVMSYLVNTGGTVVTGPQL